LLVLSAVMFIRNQVFSFFLRRHFTHSSIHTGGEEIYKLIWRQNKLMPLKRSDQMCL
jgi:hypothetical protein